MSQMGDRRQSLHIYNGLRDAFLATLTFHLKFARQLLLSSVMFPLNQKFLSLSYFDKIGGTGWTDGQDATLNATSYGGPCNKKKIKTTEQWVQNVSISKSISNESSREFALTLKYANAEFREYRSFEECRHCANFSRSRNHTVICHNKALLQSTGVYSSSSLGWQKFRMI